MGVIDCELSTTPSTSTLELSFWRKVSDWIVAGGMARSSSSSQPVASSKQVVMRSVRLLMRALPDRVQLGV